MSEPRTHLFDRTLPNGQRRAFCGQRNPPVWTDEPSDVNCQTCLVVLDADTLSEEGVALRRARDNARGRAVTALIKLHREDFARLWDAETGKLLAERRIDEAQFERIAQQPLRREPPAP